MDGKSRRGRQELDQLCWDEELTPSPPNTWSFLLLSSFHVYLLPSSLTLPIPLSISFPFLFSLLLSYFSIFFTFSLFFRLPCLSSSISFSLYLLFPSVDPSIHPSLSLSYSTSLPSLSTPIASSSTHIPFHHTTILPSQDHHFSLPLPPFPPPSCTAHLPLSLPSILTLRP